MRKKGAFYERRKAFWGSGLHSIVLEVACVAKWLSNKRSLCSDQRFKLALEGKLCPGVMLSLCQVLRTCDSLFKCLSSGKKLCFTSFLSLYVRIMGVHIKYIGQFSRWMMNIFAFMYFHVSVCRVALKVWLKTTRAINLQVWSCVWSFFYLS